MIGRTDGEMEDADVHRDHAPVLGAQPEAEVADRLAPRRHLRHGAVFRTVAVPERIAASESAGAGGSHDLLVGEAEEALAAQVPEDDAQAVVGGEDGIGRVDEALEEPQDILRNTADPVHTDRLAAAAMVRWAPARPGLALLGTETSS